MGFYGIMAKEDSKGKILKVLSAETPWAKKVVGPNWSGC
jgi:hypothetical protein